jgi:hypothetical protein
MLTFVVRVNQVFACCAQQPSDIMTVAKLEFAEFPSCLSGLLVAGGITFSASDFY